MSRVVLHRPARVLPPEVPAAPVTVTPAPQEPPDPPPGVWFQVLMPLMAGVSGMMFMIYNPRPIFIVIGATMMIGSVGMSFAMFYQQRAMTGRQAARSSSQYRSYLRQLSRDARHVAHLQNLAARFVHPGLTGLWAVCVGRVRIWERRPEHADFATVRVGTGTVPLATPLAFAREDGPFIERMPDLRRESENLIADAGRVPRQPVVLDLRATPVVSMVGPATDARRLAAGMLIELATFCAPDDLLVAICFPAAAATGWDFAKWLPHTRLAGSGLLLFPDGVGFDDLLTDELERRRDQSRRRASGLSGGGAAPGRQDERAGGHRRLLLIVDGYSAASPFAGIDAVEELAERAEALDASVLFCVRERRDEPPRVHTRVLLAPDGSFTLTSPGREEQTGQADRVDEWPLTQIARALAPYQLDDPVAATALAGTTRLVELLGFPAARELDVADLWSKLVPPHDVLRVPVGVDAHGRPEILDLKESAAGGMGPHGLVVGATGSGKSELLRTLVTALAATHPPDVLSLVLVDFKGGAAFAGLADLPHVAGMITNLADDLTMVDRMYLALFGEQQRRQKLLREAGNVDNVREYQRRRAAGLLGDAPALPYLLIVVDEFGELLAGRPDFIELFVTIGRLGRSLGMHLLLSSQRLDEGRLRGLESHLSYRICLRTFSAVESTMVIGTPDAYHLPPIPGSAYLKVDTTIYERFRAALVSAPDRTGLEQPEDSPRPALFAVPGTPGTGPFGPTGAAAGTPAVAGTGSALVLDAPGAAVVARAPGAALALAPRPGGLATAADETDVAVPAAADEGGAQGPEADRPTEMAVTVGRVQAVGAEPVHQVWLPPLEPRIPLGRLLPPLARDPRRGLAARGWPTPGQGVLPLGVLDLPEEQAQRGYTVDLAEWAGHLVVVGAPQSGKSTLLRTLLLGGLVTHTPDELHIYAVDFGGGSLFPLAGAPHVGSVCGRLEPDRVRRTVSQVWKLVEEREELFRAEGIESAAAMRERRAAAASAPDGETRPGGGARGAAEPLDLADVVLAVDGWWAVRAEFEDLDSYFLDIAARGLRVGVHLVLTANRWQEIRPQLRDNIPGRLELRLNDPGDSQISRKAAATLPAGIAGRALTAQGNHVQVALPDLGATAEEVAAASATAWPGRTAPPVRLLPTTVTAEELPAASERTGQSGVPIGVEEVELSTVHLDLDGADPHFLVLGDAESGKTTFLRSWLAGLQASKGPEQAMFLVVDYRRTLLGAVRPEATWAYCGAAPAAAAAVQELAEGIVERLPPPTLDARALAERSWWSGPEFYVVVDDYDLVASPATNPLLPLVDLLAQGRDLGLHLVLARRVGGMARGGFEPLLGRLRELRQPGLLMSGDAAEGPVLGNLRATPLPPGRGMLVRRKQRPVLVQTIHTDPSATGAP